MRNASATLIALLNDNSQFAVADLLTIIQADGTISRFTSDSVDITCESQYDSASHVFSAGLPFTRGATKLVIGVEVDTLTVTLFPSPTANLLGGLPWPAACAAGALDGAEVWLEKAIMPTQGDTTPGTLILFAGFLSSPTFDRTKVVLEVKSAISRMQQPFPRNTYQPACVHALFDAGCGVNRATYVQTGSVNGSPTASVIPITVVQANGYFDLGTITFTSGANSGLSRFIKSHASNQLTLAQPLPVAPTVGNTFSIVPGCNKLQTTCDTKFANLARFRGYPYVPVSEEAR